MNEKNINILVNKSLLGMYQDISNGVSINSAFDNEFRRLEIQANQIGNRIQFALKDYVQNYYNKSVNFPKSPLREVLDELDIIFEHAKQFTLTYIALCNKQQ